MTEYYPMKMKPSYKDYLWGGEKLKTEFGKTDGPDILAESWELADHRDGSSIVAEGQFAGNTIGQLGEINKNGFWGRKCSDNRFPLMVKLIDACKDLSVQVHPSDNQAIYDGESGKAEMWYVVNCDSKAYLYLGMKKEIPKEKLIEAAEDGTLCNLLNKVYVNKGDVFFIEPGTIHAIGQGVVIAEIQQNSNTTFRIYDYQRKDKNGNLRELHLKRAKDVATLKPIVPKLLRSTGSMVFDEFVMTEMYIGEFFRAYQIDIKKEITLKCDGTSFHHVLCVGGQGIITHDNKNYIMEKGTSYFMPARLGEYSIKGNSRVLLSRI